MHYCSVCQEEATHFDRVRCAWLCGAHAEPEPADPPSSPLDAVRADLLSRGFSVGFVDRLLPYLGLREESSYSFDPPGGRYTTLEVRSGSGDDLCVVRAHFDLSSYLARVCDYSPATGNEYVTAEVRDDNPSSPEID